MVRLLGCLAVLTLGLGCSKRGAECTARFDELEKHLTARPEPTGPGKFLSALQVPGLPRERVRPFDAEGALVLQAGYGSGAIVGLSGVGTLESFRHDSALDSKSLEKDVAALLEKHGALVLYVAVPNRDHAMEDLDSILSGLDARVELRLLVSVEGSAGNPFPADASEELRKKVARLEGLEASDRSSGFAKVLETAIGECKAITQALMGLKGGPLRDGLPALMTAARSCGCGTVDVPALETLLRIIVLHESAPEFGWVPLSLSSPTGTVEEFALNKTVAADPEPGLGVACSTDADCTAAAPTCRTFDRSGRWDPRGEGRCTHPCRKGCPRGFRCARELIPTGTRNGQLELEVLLWCAEVGGRVTATPLDKIPREVGLRYFGGELATMGGWETLFRGEDGKLAVVGTHQFKRFARDADAYEAFALLCAFDTFEGRSPRLDALLPISVESLDAAPRALKPEDGLTLSKVTPEEGFRHFAGSGPVLYWRSHEATLLRAGTEKKFSNVKDALKAFRAH